jgi:hypothetical protein
LIRHGDPGDPQCATDPEHCTFHPAHNLDAVDPDIEARVGAIGPAPNPANNHWLALQHYKYGVPNTNVTLPNSTCSTCTPSTIQRRRHLVQPGSGQAGGGTRRGGGGHPLAVGKHRPSPGPLSEGDVGQLDKLKGLITIDGVGTTFANSGTTAADYKNIPYLFFRGYYPGRADATYQTNVNAIRAAGGTADFISLADPRFGGEFKGVTHMMMLGTKASEVFDVILDWAHNNIKGGPKKTFCGK